MRKLVAVLGAAVISLGLVTACDQSRGPDFVTSTESGGVVGDGGSSPEPDDNDAIDVDQWVDDYTA
ncbi:MAG: hypothetical protein LBU50_07490, partial [Cellulomonas sp.]|nr:hypothetical protein [Cellulomonas sp.]